MKTYQESRFHLYTQCLKILTKPISHMAILDHLVSVGDPCDPEKLVTYDLTHSPCAEDEQAIINTQQ